MKKFTMSLAATAVLATGAFAIDTSAGTISGEIGAYHYASSEAKDGYTMGSASLNFETKDMSGFKAALGVMANVNIAEQTDGNWDDNSEDAVLNVANVSYASEAFTVIAGRQAIDLEWIADYHEAVVGVVTAVPNLTLVAGYTQAFNANANDGSLANFADIGEDGAMVIDATYKASDALTVGAYYMSAKDLFSAVGGKVEADLFGLGVVAKYAQTSEDTTGTADGSIMALDLGYKVGEVSLNGGYISTDSKGGIGSISALGDNINPLDSGNQVYTTDATTLYAGLSTSVAGFDLGALYGTTDYAGAKESEINLSASWECKLVKGLNMSVLYANIAGDTSATDETYYSIQAVYSF